MRIYQTSLQQCFSVNTAKNIGTLSFFTLQTTSANEQFLEILERFSKKSVETVRQRKISNTGN